jgi:uncharacterized delta-60 repeat protein
MRIRLTLVSLLLVAIAAPASADPGDLDTRFSGDGLVTAFSKGSVGTAIAVDGQRRIVVVGYTLDGKVDVAVARYLPDGSPDPTFGGGDGRARVDVGGPDYAFGVAIAEDDGLVVVGQRSGATSSRGFVIRLGHRGVPMKAFGGGDGIQPVGFGKPYQGLNTVALTPKGRIVVGGYTSNGTLSRSAIARLLPDGRFDPGFSVDGRYAVDLSAGGEQVNDLLILRDGRIVAAGYAEVGLQPRFSLFRVLGKGSLDRTFGTRRGWTLTNVAAGADVANALVIRPDGTLALAGRTANGGRDDWAIARFGFRGRLDTTFGTDGVVITGSRGRPDEASDLVAWGARLLVVGDMHATSGGDLAVIRLKAGGALDPTFGGGDGITRIDIAGAADDGRGAALQPDGKLVIGGSTVEHDTYRVLVARFLNR